MPRGYLCRTYSTQKSALSEEFHDVLTCDEYMPQK